MTDSQPSHGPAKSDKPRLLFVVTEAGYFASHKRDLARAAADAGFDVYVATRTDGDTAALADLPVNVIPLTWVRTGSIVSALVNLVPDVRRVRTALRQARADVVHAIALKPAIIVSLAVGPWPVKVIHSINGFGYIFYARSLVARLVQWGCRKVLLRSARRDGAQFILQNTDDLAYARTRIGVSDTQSHLIPGSGIDPEHFTPAPEPEGKSVRFLILARLIAMKGIAVAVAALEQVRARGVDAELVICGAPDPGNPTSIPQEHIDASAQSPGVTFKGQVSDVRPEIAQAHAMLVPSLGGEGLPRAALEAAALARPIIASDIPGNRDIVSHEGTGLLVPPGDAKALADAMCYVAANSEDRAAWGQAARRRVEAEFSAQSIRHHHLALYQTLARELP